jgi:hypothetical protein
LLLVIMGGMGWLLDVSISLDTGMVMLWVTTVPDDNAATPQSFLLHFSNTQT